MSTLLEQMEKDVAFGHDIMHAAGIRVMSPVLTTLGGLYINIMCWFSKGQRVGPVFCYFESNEFIQLMWPYKIREPRIYQSTLKKAVPIIKKTGHSGLISLKLAVQINDGKAYGLSWTTHTYQEVLRAMKPLLRFCSPAEWIKLVNDGCDGDWMDKEFNYTYSGRIVEGLTDVNGMLLAFKSLGYELPLFNSEVRQTPDEEASASPSCAPVHSGPQRRPKSSPNS